MSDTAADGLPPLRTVIDDHGLRAKKALGQNFLLDLNLTGRVARASGDLEGAHVVEVGPGPGGLTRALLAEGAAHVVAIERDARCLPALAEISHRYPGRLTVIEGDALAVDPSAHLSGPPRIVANLPYNVGTELLVRWMTPGTWPPPWTSLTLMFQREVAERIVARPGTKAYGRLAVLCQWRARPRLCFDIPPQAFVPAPKVTSTVIHIAPDVEPAGVPPRHLERIVAAAFNQRRKMLRQALKPLGSSVIDALEKIGVDPTRRAETVSVEDFVALARTTASGS